MKQKKFSLSYCVRLLVILMTGLCVFLQFGCSHGPSDDEIVSQNAAFIAQTKSIKDPWESRNKIIHYENQLFEAYHKDHCVLQSPCQDSPPNQSLEAEASRYEALALQQMNTDAIFNLFSDNTAKGDRREIASKVLAIAKASNDSSMLAIAGDIERNGVYTVRDTSLAVEYYARSWALGNPQAANAAAMALYSVNDMRNAYLWSLRCIGGCSRDWQIALAELEKKFTPEAAKQIQKAASDTATIELHD